MPHSVFLSILIFSFFLAAPASAQSGSSLRERFTSMIRDAALGDGLSVLIAEGDQEVFSLRPDVTRNPASNMKLLTAAAALEELGPNFQMRTGLYGRVDRGRINDLVLRGYGDPDLRTRDFDHLAAALVDRGIRSVNTIWIDGSYFDDEFLPPAFDQQPNEAAAFRAAVGAIALERSSYVLRVLPGERSGAPAFVRLGASGYFDVDNQIITSDGGAPNIIASQRALDDGRLRVVLRGTIPHGILGAGYRRRIHHPLVHAGYAMADALALNGIEGQHSVQIGTGPRGLALLTSHASRPLSQLLYRVGKIAIISSRKCYSKFLVLNVQGQEVQHKEPKRFMPCSNVRAKLEITREL